MSLIVYNSAVRFDWFNVYQAIIINLLKIET